MSAAFKRGKKLSIYVPMREGYVQRSIGTDSPRLAKLMKRAMQELKADRRWPLLDAIREQRLSVGDVYDAYVARTLDALEASLAAVDLAEHVDGWLAWLGTQVAHPRTRTTYLQQLRTLIPDGSVFLATALTPARVTAWETALTATTGTRRKYRYALKSFIRYCLNVGALTVDPIAALRAPKNNPARVRWEPMARCRQLVDAQTGAYRVFSALIHATGAEVGAALKMRRRDVDLAQRLAHVPGTKTSARDRHDVDVLAWAVPILSAHCTGLLPDAPLFPKWQGWVADPTRGDNPTHKAHARACVALGIADYTQHDARHSWAVDARKRGLSLEAIRDQLGHKSLASTMIYAAFKPTLAERRAEEQA